MLSVLGQNKNIGAAGIPLTANFESYSSMRSTVMALEGAGYKVEFYSEQVLDESIESSCEILFVEGFNDEGIRGDLFLGFLNDRLMKVTFEPEDISAYVEILERRYGTPLHPGKGSLKYVPRDERTVLHKYGRVFRVPSIDGIDRIAWVDVRLERERRDIEWQDD
jgi:hypothetical protein